jgi:hypothetical protein
MANKIKPSQISAQVGYDIAAAADFAADLLEDVNDHNMAAALRAVNAGEYDLACEIIQIEKEHLEAGHLTTELRERRDALLDRLRQALSS